MAAAERRAASGEGLRRPGAQLAVDTADLQMTPPLGVTPRWYNAAVPILTVILVVLGGLYTSGRASVGADASLMDIFGAADPFATLLWGSAAGCIVGIALSVAQRILTVQESLNAWVAGMKAMFLAMIILTLAWSLGQVTEDLGTAQYVAQIISGALPLEVIPVLVFLTSAAMAFATGTSWATMAIMLPLVIPLTVTLGGAGGFGVGGEYSILLGSISSVLAGAIFVDRCCPMSEPTDIRATAAASGTVAHVRTARRKAWPAVSFGNDTFTLSESTQQGRPELGIRSVAEAIMLPGVVPVRAAGSIDAGIGVYGASPESDDACDRAGHEPNTDRLKP